MVAATPLLARSLKHDPAHAVLLGAGSPLVLLSLLAGDHNDALMVGLLVAGLAVAGNASARSPGDPVRSPWRSPAALGVLFLGWAWAGTHCCPPAVASPTAGAGAIALATMEVSAHLGNGLGLGTHDHDRRRLHRRHARQRGGAGVSIFSHLAQVPISTMQARPVFSVLGLLIAGYVGYRLLMRSPRDGVVRCLGLTLLVLALLD